jgi:hypothetical protein
MKDVVVMICLSLAVFSCSTLTSAERAEREAKIERAVAKMLAEHRYAVTVNMMFPRNGRAQNVTSDYSLEVRGDSLVSYLPYYGRAYSVPFGGGKGLNFATLIKNYHSEKGKKGNTRVEIEVDNTEDCIRYSLDIFPNGSTTIDVIARERDPISYSGQMEIDEDSLK